MIPVFVLRSKPVFQRTIKMSQVSCSIIFDANLVKITELMFLTYSAFQRSRVSIKRVVCCSLSPHKCSQCSLCEHKPWFSNHDSSHPLDERVSQSSQVRGTLAENLIHPEMRVICHSNFVWHLSSSKCLANQMPQQSHVTK